MKTGNLFLLICVCAGALSCTKKSTIELPMTAKDGYGPFPAGFRGVSPYSENENDPWIKTRLQVTGIPADWTDVKSGDMDTDIHQTVYQDYLLGNISQELYETLQQSWNWTPDTLNLSGTPLKTKIAFAFGKDASGETKMVIDANNNLDFSDDTVFAPLELDMDDNSLNRDSLTRKNVIAVTYERLSENKIVREKSQLFIVYVKQYNIWMCNFPQYETALLDGSEIAVCTDHFLDLSYNKPLLVLMDDSLKNGKKAGREALISLDEYVAVNGKFYKNKGVNRNRNVLILEKTDLPQNELYSTQIGFKILPFEGVDFKTKDTLSPDKYRGKYLLLDFWAVWCGPCIQEFPGLKSMYDRLDKSRVEIVGIVGDSPAEELERAIERHAITWPQILSNETNRITKTYHVTGYPTTLLIDPEGIVVAKNLRGKELEDRINELVGNR
jgi:thiol-disulfide isomerase/thioredoxin